MPPNAIIISRKRIATYHRLICVSATSIIIVVAVIVLILEFPSFDILIIYFEVLSISFCIEFLACLRIERVINELVAERTQVTSLSFHGRPNSL
ncbi:uncharacterized protein FTOL_13789 [Fusarium torulosum]|uniref:Uncharacterized protein n=1 Tax=Fusarium torulosum TaxID=33205 RepID=A0AAE8SQJ9_9HYPO|nr:uncharacterized protein FTOL_13789 [Fusarium torulosum]